MLLLHLCHCRYPESNKGIYPHATVYHVVSLDAARVVGAPEGFAPGKRIVEPGKRKCRYGHGFARAAEEGAYHLDIVKRVMAMPYHLGVVLEAAENGSELAFECRRVRYFLVGVHDVVLRNTLKSAWFALHPMRESKAGIVLPDRYAPGPVVCRLLLAWSSLVVCM